MLEHGGNLWKASRVFGVPRHAWIDLSTGINPHSWLTESPPAELWRDLPQTMDLLEEAAAGYYGAGNLCPVAGVQAAIQWLPALRHRFFGISRVAVPRVGFAEHRRCWGLWHDMRSWTDEELPALLPELDVLVVINPNSPSGVRYEPEQLLAWHQELAARDGWLIVDETFIDTLPEQSLAQLSNRPGLFVLRSLGKFFGLGGLRVGFVLGEQDMLDALRELMGPWNISTPSRWIAERALRDREWQASMRRLLADESRALAALLRDMAPNAGLRGTELFQTITTPRAPELFEYLARLGILTRLTDERDAVRIGLPASSPQWAALERALVGFEF